MSKAKLKKLKKAEQEKNNGIKCKTCEFNFISREILEDHLY
jgi:hypothetical protein